MKPGGYIDERKEATRLDIKVPNPIEARRAYTQIFAYFADDALKKQHFKDVPEACTYPRCNANTHCVYGADISPELRESIEKLIEGDMQKYLMNKNPDITPEVAAEQAESGLSFLNIHGKEFYNTCRMGGLRELHGSENETKEKIEARGNGHYKRDLKTAKRLISEGRTRLKSAELLLNTESYDTIMDLCYSPLTKPDLGDTHFIDEILPASMETERAMLRQAQRGQMKKDEAVNKIQQGLKIYVALLSSENLEHFNRIKTAVGHTINEFENYLPENALEQYHNALFIGPE